MTDTRRKLLDAIEVVLADGGLAKLSLRRVAAVAGVSHAAPGVVFGDKAGLLTAFATEGFDALAEVMRGALTPTQTGPETLAAVGRAYVRFALGSPELFEVMFRQDLLSLHDPTYRQAARAAAEPLELSVRRCMEDGLVAPSRADDVLLAAWSLVHGLVALWRSKHLVGRIGVADPAVVAHQITALFAGLLDGDRPLP